MILEVFIYQLPISPRRAVFAVFNGHVEFL